MMIRTFLAFSLNMVYDTKIKLGNFNLYKSLTYYWHLIIAKEAVNVLFKTKQYKKLRKLTVHMICQINLFVISISLLYVWAHSVLAWHCWKHKIHKIV